MNDYLHYGVPLILAVFVYYKIKHHRIRAHLGVLLIPLGFIVLWGLPHLATDVDVDFFALGAVTLGANLYFSRERFQVDET